MNDSRILFAGLGNPGNSYVYTRHNVGFRVIDYIAQKESLDVSKKSFDALWGQLNTSVGNIILLKPQTFMNLSGRSVRSIASFYKIPAERIVIVCDDFALPIGTIRLRKEGSDGGHNGLANIIQELSCKNFNRLRIGVGPLPQGASSVDFVLSKFSKIENEFLDKTIIPKTAEALMFFAANDAERTMNTYNTSYES